MISLNVKAKIYQYTGIYLAKTEHTQYMWSKEAIDEIKRLMASPDDYPADVIYGIVLGSWQAQHGFYRSFSHLVLREPRWLWRPIASISVSISMIKQDLSKLLKG